MCSWQEDRYLQKMVVPGMKWVFLCVICIKFLRIFCNVIVWVSHILKIVLVTHLKQIWGSQLIWHQIYFIPSSNYILDIVKHASCLLFKCGQLHYVPKIIPFIFRHISLDTSVQSWNYTFQNIESINCLSFFNVLKN